MFSSLLLIWQRVNNKSDGYWLRNITYLTQTKPSKPHTKKEKIYKIKRPDKIVKQNLHHMYTECLKFYVNY